jgi:hypothetical protein
MRYHSLPENPFNDPPPRTRLANALLYLPRLFVAGLSIIAAAVYFFVVNPDDEPERQP